MSAKKERQLSFDDHFETKDQQMEQLQKERTPISLLLDGLDNPRNIGMIFRLAEAARLKCVYTYKMEGLSNSKKLVRAARSADRYLDIRTIKTLEEIKKLKAENELVGLEITTKSRSFTTYHPARPVVLILGNEKTGISQELIDLSDQCIHIPMLGLKTSMNVAVATGIAVYHLLAVTGHLKKDEKLG